MPTNSEEFAKWGQSQKFSDVQNALFATCLHNIGEYEHGTADVSDLFEGIYVPGLNVNAVCLEVYVRVCQDLILCHGIV